MSHETQPVFIIGSGRCGTRAFYKLLAGLDGVEAHHEYVCTHIQPVAAKYFMGLIDKKKAALAFKKLHGAAITYSPGRIWIDSSNKLTWLIEPILEVYPNAKFLALVRDGRKVTASFYYKLGPEIYDDESVAIMQRWLVNPRKYPEPPPEKKYWWNIPQPGQEFYEDFKNFNQFERICYHWYMSNKFLVDHLSPLPEQQKKIVLFEDVIKSPDLLKETLLFIGIPYDDIYYDLLQKPQNVFYPLDFQLTRTQQAKFDQICSPMMKEFGYNKRESYVVHY